MLFSHGFRCLPIASYKACCEIGRQIRVTEFLLKPELVRHEASSAESGQKEHIDRKLTPVKTARNDVATVTALSKSRLWREAVDVLEQMMPSDISNFEVCVAYSAAIDACGKKNKWTSALFLFATLVRSSTTPNGVVVGASIAACHEGHRWEEAIWLLANYPVRDNMASAATIWSAAITACGKSARWEQALCVIAQVIRARSQNKIVYNASISALGKGSQWQLAMFIFAWTLKTSLKPDIVTFASLIDACEKGSQWTCALHLLADMSHHHLNSSTLACSSAISSCAQAAEWVMALGVFSRMTSHDRVLPDLVSYNASISACEKGKQWESAVKFLELLQQRDLRPSVVTFNAALSACFSQHQWEQILQLLQDMTDRCLRPDTLASVAAAEALSKQGSTSKALEAYRAAVDARTLKAPRYGRRYIDLHNHYEEVARLAILAWFQTAALMAPDGDAYGTDVDLQIVTGRGKHSAGGLAVLRPMVMQMLTEELGLNAYVDIHNVGQVIIPRGHLQQIWSPMKRCT